MVLDVAVDQYRPSRRADAAERDGARVVARLLIRLSEDTVVVPRRGVSR